MNDLIRVVQLPVIEEQLLTLKQHWEQMASDAKAMVCNEETIKSVKRFRADMRKEFAEVDALRSQIRKAVIEPYLEFDAKFEVCVSTPFHIADTNFKEKITEVESEIKGKCEESLREYFDELCAAHHVEWVKYEQAGIKIDMASAQQKTPKRLRERLVFFVVNIASDVDTISTMAHAEEILAEYKDCLSLSQAIGTVLDRHRRIESERQALDTRSTEKAAEIEAERRIEALTPPKQISVPPDACDEWDPREEFEFEIIPRCTFTAINATRKQLRALKEFLDMEGIKYES